MVNQRSSWMRQITIADTSGGGCPGWRASKLTLLLYVDFAPYDRSSENLPRPA